jgi:hypothetical protein
MDDGRAGTSPHTGQPDRGLGAWWRTRGSSWRRAAGRVRIASMTAMPRCPAAQRDHERLKGRRLRAVGVFAVGVRQSEVGHQSGVRAQAVSLRHARWRTGGTDSLRSQSRATLRQGRWMSCSSLPTGSRKLWDPGADRRGDLAADGLAGPARAHVGAATPPAALRGAATGVTGCYCIEAAVWVRPATRRSCHAVKFSTQYEVTRYDLNAALLGLEAHSHCYQESLGASPLPVSARVDSRWL